jgi:hypothetical protein
MSAPLKAEECCPRCLAQTSGALSVLLTPRKQPQDSDEPSVLGEFLQKIGRDILPRVIHIPTH